MTTTVIDTNTVNAGDGFDPAANGDTVVVAPNVLLASEAHDGVSSSFGGYVIDDGDIFGPLVGVSLGGVSTDYSEVWVAAQGIVQGAGGQYGVVISSGPFAIQNYGHVLCAGLRRVCGIQRGRRNPGQLRHNIGYGGWSCRQRFPIYRPLYLHTMEQSLGQATRTQIVAMHSSPTDWLLKSILNSGTMNGSIVLSNGAGDLVNSTLGTVIGTITAGTGGDTIIAGQSGGSVVGGYWKRHPLRQPDPNSGQQRGADHPRRGRG